MSVIQDQGIVFYNKIIGDIIYKTAKADDPNSDIGFIIRYRDMNVMNEIINDLTLAINGNYNLISDLEVSNDIDIAFIGENQIEFYDQDVLNILYTSPLTEFLEVLLAWRDFMLTPPLHGSKAGCNWYYPMSWICNPTPKNK